MYFNRFNIEREKEFCLVQFGLVTASGLMDSFSCVFSNEALKQSQESLMNYLNRTGRPEGNSAIQWKGIAVEKHTHIADIISMAVRGKEAETCLFFFSHSGATRLSKGSASNTSVPAQPLALLRSTTDLQKQLIIALYDKE
jgi:hypothetical protein